MVLYTNCEGNVKASAKAIVAAAVTGDQDAFAAGFTAGVARLQALPEQLADTLSQTFTEAYTQNRTLGVAAGLAGAVGKMQGSQLTDFIEKIVIALNNMASSVSCSAAGETAGSLLQALNKLNGMIAKQFMQITMSSAAACWSRRVQRLSVSPLANATFTITPCTRAAQEAAAVSVSLVTASTCGNTPLAVSGAAQAMVTASIHNGCAFASAVTAASLWGLPNDALVNVFTAAITKAQANKTESQLAASLAASYGEIAYDGGPKSQADDVFLASVLKAIAKAIDVSGCTKSTVKFVQAVYNNLVEQNPVNKADIKHSFLAVSQIKRCQAITTDM